MKILAPLEERRGATLFSPSEGSCPHDRRKAPEEEEGMA
jgi:hypothetical protein